ncbi:ROK family protein [Streptomyces cavernicola]|uniref:ROK family protein n=1 Tax=Streptomyces cavernicola TaxID=3043613 RepID=A0ABT6SA05_9ACTN|nr:ROK family protein [Streptomyces sp. B-S-A6]MDI3405013.1 ROK family protein [Streptomyces sp. B-S-A6]
MSNHLAPLEPKADKAAVRRHNLSLVLRSVHDEGETTRAAVAARSGLTRAAVSSLVEQLLGGGFLSESGKSFSGQAGRPGTVLKVARTGPAGVGVEINVDCTTVCVVDLSGVDRVRLTEHHDNRGAPPADVLARAARITARALESAAAQELHPAGAHLALPGLVSGGTVRQAPNLGWTQVRAAELFEQALSDVQLDEPVGTQGRPRSRDASHPALLPMPVSSGNEADAAALAELWFGGRTDTGGRGLRTFLYLTGEIGIGGALVVDGELLPGAHGFAGEIGHTVVDEDGPLCRCGSHGCLEQYAGQAALLRAAGLPEDAGPPGVTDLERRARDGDESALAALTAAGRTLGLVLANAVNLIDPDAIVLGGAYRPLLPWLGPPIAERLARRVVSGLWSEGSGRLHASSAAGDAARGSAALVVRDVLADPLAYAERTARP